jgi:hypothetical protein
MRRGFTLALLLILGCQSAYDDQPLTLAEAQEVYAISLAELERLTLDQRDAVDRGDDTLAESIGKKIDEENKRGWKAYERVKRLKAAQ